MSTCMENFRGAGPLLPFSLLNEITNCFSQERLIGDGGYGAVYKGVCGDGQVIAVRMLRTIGEIDEKEFHKEIASLMKIRHQNIVRLIGYCCEQEQVIVPYGGNHAFALKTHRALCLEYLQKGSLDRYVSDISSGLDWNMRYAIIKGVCEGLRYLGEGLKSHVHHLDLKPSNILLDQNMTPKISDFGLSRLIGEGNAKRMGTIEYMPPEFIEKQVISHEFDIYSLGVVILKVIAGCRPGFNEMTGSRQGCNDVYSNKFAKLVLEQWRERLEKTVNGTPVERHCQRVKKCMEIALKCVEYDRHERPSIGDIVHRLNEIENLLDVQPTELYFPLMLRERKKAMTSSCLLQLKNRGDDRVAFMLDANSTKRCLTKMPLCGVVPPRSAKTLAVTVRTLEALSISSDNISDSGDFFTLRSIALSPYDLLHVDKDLMSIKYRNFFKKAQETASIRDEVKVATLNVIYDRGAAESAGTSPEDRGRVSSRSFNDGITWGTMADEHDRKI